MEKKTEKPIKEFISKFSKTIKNAKFSVKEVISFAELQKILKEIKSRKKKT